MLRPKLEHLDFHAELLTHEVLDGLRVAHCSAPMWARAPSAMRDGVYPPLEQADDGRTRQPIAEPAGEIGVVFRLEGEAAQRIAGHGVEAGGDQHQVRLPVGRRCDDRGPQIADIERPAGADPRHVETLPTPRSSAMPVPGYHGCWCSET